MNFRTIAAIIALFGLRATAGPLLYTVTDLGIFSPVAINDSGEVAGTAPFASAIAPVAVLYSNGVLQELGSLGFDSSVPYGLNNDGQVVGLLSSSTGTENFLYSDGTMTILSGLSGAYASGINDAGQIIGWAPPFAFIYSGGSLDPLGSVDEFAQPYATNESGQVVGLGLTSSGDPIAVLYSGGIRTDLGPSGSTASGATAINESGQVVGWFSSPGFVHAFLYSAGSMINLGTIGGQGSISHPHGINDAGQIVGYSHYDDSFTIHAFFWVDGIMYDLNDLVPAGTPEMFEAIGINSSGQIIARGWNGREAQALLLTPVDVPEPATYGLFLAGLALTAILRRRG